jgi:peptide chain release factor 1
VKASLRDKLTALTERHEEIAHLLSDPQTIKDQGRFRDLSREYARLADVAKDFGAFCALERDIQAARELAASDDAELRALGEEELESLRKQTSALEEALAVHLVPRDPDDDANLFLEIRAGTGGDEAAIFAGDLFRMYSRYAEHRGWQLEILSSSSGEHGGYKEVISRVVGTGAYARLKFESGAHRVQRVPETEAQGRVHTSACTVAVLPESEDVGEIELNAKDLRIDTFRASGAGASTSTKRTPAIRIAFAERHDRRVWDERSRTRIARAQYRLLKATATRRGSLKRQNETAEKRRSLVGTGDRSERIRTQLSARARDGPSDQPHALQAQRRHRGRSRRRHRSARRRISGREARRARYRVMSALPADGSRDAAGERQESPIGVLLASAERALRPHSPTPRLDAEVLLAFCACLPRASLLAFPERSVSAPAAAHFAAAVARRARGEPVAYVRGEKEFYSLTLLVTPSVLVPRADTELLVDTALHCLSAAPRRTVLDVGTGSGAIALAIKQQRPDVEVTAADCDPGALAVARENARRLGLEIRCVESYWLDSLHGRRFDLIVSNPPYVRSGDPALAGELRHEPRVALDGGGDGLAAYRAILAAAPRHLEPHGLLLLEHGFDQRADVLALARASGLQTVAVHDDLAGVPRVAVFAGCAP